MAYEYEAHDTGPVRPIRSQIPISPQSLERRTAVMRTTASGAGEAMTAGHDSAMVGLARIGIPKKMWSVGFFPANQLTINSRIDSRTRAK